MLYVEDRMRVEYTNELLHEQLNLAEVSLGCLQDTDQVLCHALRDAKQVLRDGLHDADQLFAGLVEVQRWRCDSLA
ncbi:hypothetical protein HAX54_020515, partial [Datura stramonium]|nr:hypothetical protein [Datura stramonium]